jgi:hypothetical protein
VLDSFTEDYVQAMRDMFFYVARFEVNSVSLDDVKVMALEYPALYLYVIEQGKEEGLIFDKNPTPADVLKQSVVYDDGGSVNLIPFVINGTIDYARNVVRVYSRRDEIKAAVKSVKEKRLLVIMELDKPRRVHSDLDRAFYRTLSELRKHQQWRQARNIIDVTPKLPA